MSRSRMLIGMRTPLRLSGRRNPGDDVVLVPAEEAGHLGGVDAGALVGGDDQATGL